MDVYLHENMDRYRESRRLRPGSLCHGGRCRSSYTYIRHALPARVPQWKPVPESDVLTGAAI